MFLWNTEKWEAKVDLNFSKLPPHLKQITNKKPEMVIFKKANLSSESESFQDGPFLSFISAPFCLFFFEPFERQKAEGSLSLCVLACHFVCLQRGKRKSE